MHLQSLELFGFKSFADKTLFNFHEGVTAIVGPNGCGKSNLLDAIKWVLGEQSAKSLRGGEMADVIFNGTDTRKPLGFAEVSLTFTDCASELDVDWHDVRVTRRVYRDGISEYLLNKTPCRLKDIQNLFADTGVARSAYSMMEQGKIDMILSSRPEDRRAVFEEAAGITKYKTQKNEALRKLEATDANLLRIGDVIKEVKRQIGSLQRQAGKARRYQALHADLRVLDTHHSKRQLTVLDTDLADCRADIEKIVGSEQASRVKIETFQLGKLFQVLFYQVGQLPNQASTLRGRHVRPCGTLKGFPGSLYCTIDVLAITFRDPCQHFSCGRIVSRKCFARRRIYELVIDKHLPRLAYELFHAAVHCCCTGCGSHCHPPRRSTYQTRLRRY